MSRRALISGGSSGIGLALSERLHVAQEVVQLVHPLLVERVRSSGVGLVADVICDAVVEDLRHIEGLGGFGALLHDDHKW